MRRQRGMFIRHTHKNTQITLYKRILASLLILVTLITSTNLLAISNKALAIEADNGSLDVNSSQASSYAGTGWLNIRQGYRFYIVDSNYQRASDVYDFVFQTPSNVGKRFTNTRWESPSSDTSHYHLQSIDFLVNKIKSIGPAENPEGILNIPPLLILEAVNGDLFQNWFMGTNNASSNIGHTTNIGWSNNSGGGTGGSTGGNSEGSGSTVTEKTDKEEKLPTTVKIKIIGGKAIAHKNLYEQMNKLSTDELQQVVDIYSTCKSMYKSYYVASLISYPTITDTEARYYAVYNVYRALANSSKYSDKLAAYLASKCYQQVDLSGASVSAPNSVSILESNIPLAGEQSASKKYPVNNLLYGDMLKVYNFDLDVNNTGTLTALDALLYKENGTFKYFLVVEPLAWINIYKDSKTVESKRTYGSYYNLVEYMHTNTSNNTARGAHRSYFNSYGKNSLVVKSSYSKEVEGITLYAAEDKSSMNIDQIYSEMKANKGYGMQLYYGGMVLGAGTHTFDSPNSPAPAPDPSGLADEKDPEDPLNKNITIIKNYVRIEDGVEVTIGNYVREQNPHTIAIEDETKYRVIEWNTSTTNPPSITDGSTTPWNTVISNSTKTQQGKSSGSTTLSDDELVLYVKLLEISETVDLKDDNKNRLTDTEWTLQESEISKAVTTGEHTANISCVYTYGRLNNCGGHDYKVKVRDGYTDSQGVHHSSKYETRTAHCSFSITDNDYKFRRINSNESTYSNILARSTSFTSRVNEIDGSRNNNLDSGSTSTSGFKYDFIIHRGEDKLSLCEYSNKDLTPAELGYQSNNSKTSITRKITGYNTSLPILLIDNNSDLHTSSHGDSGHGTHDHEDTASSDTNIEYTGDVKIKVYSGIKRNPNTDINKTPLLNLTNIAKDKTAGRQISSDSVITFNPYIQMSYTLLDGVKKNVNVLGEYERQIIPNDYAEIQWTYNPENLIITSQQWAVDAMLTSGDKDWNNKNSVLKGGANYSLNTENQKIALNTYQTITEGLSRDNSKINGEYKLEESEAKELHELFVLQAIETYNNTNVVQYVDKNTGHSDAWSSGIAVFAGADISELSNGSSTASTEGKYYLKDDDDNVKNAMRGDLDVKELGTNVSYYRFSSDVLGNIYMKKGSSIDEVNSDKGSVILNKTQDSSSLSGDALAINSRTLVVDKLIDAIERNIGNDNTAAWAPDGRWYNEAFEGVIVMKQNTGLEIGFDAATTRNTVLDPKLIPKVTSKGDQGKEAYLSQYCTDLNSTTAISSFKDSDVYMRDAELLFTSQRFFITNMTVQDVK